MDRAVRVYATSVAVWAGAIALIGVAVETTSIMIVFLDEAWAARASTDRLQSKGDRIDATVEGAQKCLRPVLMAVGMNIFGLIPIMTRSSRASSPASRTSGTRPAERSA